MTSTCNFSELDVVDLEGCESLFLEKTGPFMDDAPVAWEEFHKRSGASVFHQLNTKHMGSLSKVNKSKNGDEKTGHFLNGPCDFDTTRARLLMRRVSGGKFARFG